MENKEKQNHFGMVVIKFLCLRKEYWETSGCKLTFYFLEVSRYLWLPFRFQFLIILHDIDLNLLFYHSTPSYLYISHLVTLDLSECVEIPCFLNAVLFDLFGMRNLSAVVTSVTLLARNTNLLFARKLPVPKWHHIRSLCLIQLQ